MTLRDSPTARPDVDTTVVLALVATLSDAAVLAPLGVPSGLGSAAELVATGLQPMEIDLALEDHGVAASRVVLVDAPPGTGPVHELAVLLTRLDDVLREAAPRGVVVRGGTPAALAAAQCAVWRGIPVVHLPVPAAAGFAAANQAAVAELVAWQTSPAGGAVPRPADLALPVYRALVPPEAPRFVTFAAAVHAVPTDLTA